MKKLKLVVPWWLENGATVKTLRALFGTCPVVLIGEAMAAEATNGTSENFRAQFWLSSRVAVRIMTAAQRPPNTSFVSMGYMTRTLWRYVSSCCA